MSPKLRFQIFARDNFTCRYCGRKPPHVELHVDHVHPQALGGMGDEKNLLTSCEECNLGKGSRMIQPIADSSTSGRDLWRFREEEMLRQEWQREFFGESKTMWVGRMVREFLMRMGPDQVRFEVRHAAGMAKSLSHTSLQAWRVFVSRCQKAVKERKKEEEKASHFGYIAAWNAHSSVSHLSPK